MTGDRFRPPRSSDPVDRSLWMQEALAGEPAALREPRPLRGDLDCDVAIVGGGFTGLWTALRLSEDDPDLRIAVLEAGVCGSGASGRNGGFATSWWHDLDAFVEHVGDEQALFLCGASSDAIDMIERFGVEHDLDVRLRRAGKVSAATCAAQVGAWDATIAASERLGVPERFRRLTGEQARARIGSPVLRDGMFMGDSASVQPALLVRGLRRVLRERGVAIHEQTPMIALDRRAPAVITPSGRIRAQRIVLAVNAWAVALPEVRRIMVPLSSHVVVTEPIPERIAALGWTGGELLLDGRMLVHYAHVTADGRIAFGRGGGAVAFGDRIGGRVLWDAGLAGTVADDLRRFFPALADVRIDAAWGGAIDRTWRHLPFFSPLPGSPSVLVGAGYSGDGVVPSVVGGRILASQVLDRDDPWTRSALTTLPAQRELPPEPWRKLGGEAVRRLVARKERLEERDRRVDPLTRAGAGLSWLTTPPPPWRRAASALPAASRPVVGRVPVDAP